MSINFPELDPFAVERSHRASQVANEHSRATAQACILINGGAATAAIAFLAKDNINPALLSSVPRCIAGYAVGVLFGSLMMFCMTQTMEQWSSYWYFNSHGASNVKAASASKWAKRWWVGYNCCFALTSLCFVISSILLGSVIYSPH